MNSMQDPTIALPAEHLTYDEIEAYVDGRADEDDRAIVAEHLAQCARCREEVTHLQDVHDDVVAERSSARFSRRRRLLAVAAALVLAVLGAWVWFAGRGDGDPKREANRPQQPRAVPGAPAPQRKPEAVHTLLLKKPPIVATLVRGEGVLRGTTGAAFALLAPVGTVVLEERPRFRWTATPDAASYDVVVADRSGNVAAAGSSRTTEWRAEAPLARGRTYTWQVTAQLADGTTVVAPAPDAPEALFHVAANVEPLPADPLARGVALANLGALDDAESALSASADPRAAGLLRQVRAWRSPSQGLPTTTNGAQ